MREFRLLFYAFAIVAFMGCWLAVHAQVPVQPTYIRPSKGAVLTVGNALATSPVVTSPVYDWTAFTAASQTLKFADASGNRCACPSGVNNCDATVRLSLQVSTDKVGVFSLLGQPFVFPLRIAYPVGAPPNSPLLVSASVQNIQQPYVKFLSEFISYIDTGTGLPVAGCYLTVTVTPIPLSTTINAEGLFPNGPLPVGALKPVVVGGLDYVPSGTPGQQTYETSTIRVSPTGYATVGGGNGNPTLLTTTPIVVAASPAAATLIYTTVSSQRGVKIQNVGTNPVYCAAGPNANNLSATRYSFVLKAGTAAGDGLGGERDFGSLDTSAGGASPGTVYCLGNGGASSVAVMPY